jgi:hypothetical protein
MMAFNSLLKHRFQSILSNFTLAYHLMFFSWIQYDLENFYFLFIILYIYFPMIYLKYFVCGLNLRNYFGLKKAIYLFIILLFGMLGCFLLGLFFCLDFQHTVLLKYFENFQFIHLEFHYFLFHQVLVDCIY